MENASQPRGIRHWLGLLQVHNIARVFLALVGDSRVSPLLKLQAACGLVYIFSPLDAMPEMFTGIGLLDDLIVSLIIMQSFIELAPADAVAQHCARIGISPAQVFLSVPQTVREARSLYAFVREFGSGLRNVGEPAETEAGVGSPEPEESPTDATRQGLAGSRYSAYRDPTAED